MTSLGVSILMRSGGGPLTRREVIVFSLVVGVGLLVSICWQIVDNWKERTHGRNWPTVSAAIERHAANSRSRRRSGVKEVWPTTQLEP